VRALSRSIPLLFALATPAVVRGEPTGPGSGAKAPTSRGLVLTSVPELTQLERTTPATDFAQNHYARRVAVTIGINSYAGRPWPRLQAAVEDAHHMASLFRAMGFDRVESLTDEAATREGLLDLMEHQLPLMVGERDLVVVFFSGHGATVGEEGYIVPRDANDDLEQTGISVQRLKESCQRATGHRS
jgi:Caspase domain